MMVFRAKGRRFYEAQVPTSKPGEWVKRPVGTMDRATAKKVDRMIEQLGPSGKQAWDVLDRVTAKVDKTNPESKAKSLTLSRLYQLWSSTPVTRHDRNGEAIEPSPDERLAFVRASLQSVNIEPLIEKWKGALVGPSINVKPDTAAHYVAAVRTLIPAGEEFARERLNETAIRSWMEDMDDVKPGTVRKRAIGLHQYIYWLRNRGTLTHDPMIEIDLPEAGDPLCHYIDTDDVMRLADGQSGQMRLLEYVLPGSALEVSTALALRVRQVRTLDKEIHAPGTKAYNRNRVVRIAEFAWDAVLELTRGKHPDSRLFDQIPHRYFARDMHYEFAKKLGAEGHRIFIECDGKPKLYTLRDHRHTWAVRAVRSGWPMDPVSKQLGHANGALAFKVYGRFEPKQEERAMWEQRSTERDVRESAERKRMAEG